MKLKTVKSYSQVVLSGLIIFAAVYFLPMQWGEMASYSRFGHSTPTRTIWIMLASAAAGLVLLPVCRVFFKGVLEIWRDRRRAAKTQTP